MINVDVNINAIIMYCDESIANISLGNGYVIEKTYLKDCEYKDKICDALGDLAIEYMGSKLFDEAGEIYFMCLHKQEIFSTQEPIIEAGVTYTDNDLNCREAIESYQDTECTFLNNVFNMLHLYKCGNIGTKSIFFEFKYCVMGIFNSNLNHRSNNITRNIVDNRLFTLSPDDITACNQFLTRVNSSEFQLIKNIIDEFSWGLEQVDLPTGFEQYTTALEMMLLEQNQNSKKECLSKRTASLIGNTNTEKQALYTQVKAFYRFRSESLHEGDGRNITKNELVELESITRASILKILELCNTALMQQPYSTWDSIKASIISDLKNQVATLISTGVFPA